MNFSFSIPYFWYVFFAYTIGFLLILLLLFDSLKLLKKNNNPEK